MNLRVLLASSLFLTAALAVAVAPAASAAPCDASSPDVSCQTQVGNCDTTVEANVVTTTAAGASADCRMGNMTRCFVAVGVGGNVLEPSVERWCAF